jgi:hypothetical protein
VKWTDISPWMEDAESALMFDGIAFKGAARLKAGWHP